MNGRYTLLEIRRILRQPRFFLFGVGIPAVMFSVLASLYGSPEMGGIAAVKSTMGSMAAFGAMTAAINIGGRVANERATGWNRLLRLTPLKPLAYVLTKLLVALLIALPAILVVYGLGAFVFGVHLPMSVWLQSGVGLWLGTIPFGVLGLFVGYLATADTSAMISSAVFLGLSMFGGLWFPVQFMPSFMAFIAKLTPSYWLGELARDPLASAGVNLQAVSTMLVWTAVIGVLAMWAYRRDTSRA
jgi:ABC-2 type transport system permease protein